MKLFNIDIKGLKKPGDTGPAFKCPEVLAPATILSNCLSMVIHGADSNYRPENKFAGLMT